MHQYAKMYGTKLLPHLIFPAIQLDQRNKTTYIIIIIIKLNYINCIIKCLTIAKDFVMTKHSGLTKY